MPVATANWEPQLTEPKREVLRVASELFRQKPDWLTFFREVLGIDGIARRAFSTQESYSAFERSQEYDQIQSMISALRHSHSNTESEPSEAIRVITVRLPASLHEALKDEAHNRKVSMNKLCINKLVQELSELSGQED